MSDENFAKLAVDLPSILTKLVPGATVEIEVRIKDYPTYQANNKTRELTVGTFYRALDIIKESSSYNLYQTSHITDKYMKGIVRYSTFSEIDKEGIAHEKVVWMEKQNIIGPFYNNDLCFNLAVSSERIIPSPARGDAVPSTIIKERIKNRTSFRRSEIQIDFTQVEQKDNEKYTVNYEIELEIVGIPTSASISKLREETMNLLKIVRGTNILYKNTTRISILKHIYTILGQDGTRDASLVQARNLKMRDMIGGGLFGDKIRSDEVLTGQNAAKCHYTVTVKADGLRKLLVIYQNCLWLIYPNNEFCLVKILPAGINLNGTILDGEVLYNFKYGRNKQSKIYFLAFDCLCYTDKSSAVSILNKPHNKRLQFANEIIDEIATINDTQFAAGKKNFFDIGDTYASFKDAILEVFGDRTLDGREDGLIFTPDEAPYDSHTDRQSMNKRNLFSFPDICKWKDFENLTIDLQLTIPTSGQLEKGIPFSLFAGPGKKSKEASLFRGTLSFPFNLETQVDWLHPIFNNIKGNPIIEFKPRRDDDDHIILEPLKIRYGKNYPNSIDTANDIWTDINRPLDKNTLLGETFALLRNYFNDIKRRILQPPFELMKLLNVTNHNEIVKTVSKLKQSDPQVNFLARNFDENFTGIPEGSFVVDIGAGRGGDLAKINHIGKLLAIEPNEKNFDEYQKRLHKINRYSSTKPFEHSVKLLKCGGEDTDLICEAASDLFYPLDIVIPELHIIMMLSLSFFWSSKEILKKLGSTINRLAKEYHEAGGTSLVKFHFFTIEGDATDKFFENHPERPVTLGPLTMDLEGNKVEIHIDETIVDNQTEWIVRLNELWEVVNFKPNLIKKINEEIFLSQEETEYTNLFVYGFATEHKRMDSETIFELHDGAKKFIQDFENLISREGAERLAQGDEDENTYVDGEGAERLVRGDEDENTFVDGEEGDGEEPEDFIGDYLGPACMVDITKLSITKNLTFSAHNDDRVFNWSQEYEWNDRLLQFNITLPCIDDKNSIFHCILKATSKTYRESPSAQERINMVSDVRTSLRELLTTSNPHTPLDIIIDRHLTIWKCGDGVLPADLVTDDDLKNVPNDCFFYTVADGFLLEYASLNSLRFGDDGFYENVSLSRHEWLGVSDMQFSYSYIRILPEMLGINLLVLHYYEYNEHRPDDVLHRLFSIEGDHNLVVVRRVGGNLFELIGQKEGKNIFTYF
jgi:hypothetical protein